jgi:hypothetical protein
MGKRKLNVPALQKLEQRIKGLKNIDPNLSFQNGLSVQTGEAVKTALISLQEQYNTLLSQLEALRIDISNQEKEATKYCKNALMAVKSNFGDDSSEYEKAGGKPLSKRKTPVRTFNVAKTKKEATV